MCSGFDSDLYFTSRGGHCHLERHRPLALAEPYAGELDSSDAERTAFLEKFGLLVIRIPNIEINTNFEGVCDYLDEIIKNRL